MTAVIIVPASMPSIGFENIVKNSAVLGFSARGFMALHIVSIPVINTESPITAHEAFCTLSFFENTKGREAAADKKYIIYSPENRAEVLCEKANKADVAVVPIFAPSISPAAAARLSTPLSTKLTAITLTAEEDCKKAVVTEPKRTERLVVEQQAESMWEIFDLDKLSMFLVINFMPKKKNPIPPSSIMILVITSSPFSYN